LIVCWFDCLSAAPSSPTSTQIDLAADRLGESANCGRPAILSPPCGFPIADCPSRIRWRTPQRRRTFARLKATGECVDRRSQWLRTARGPTCDVTTGIHHGPFATKACVATFGKCPKKNVTRIPDDVGPERWFKTKPKAHVMSTDYFIELERFSNLPRWLRELTTKMENHADLRNEAVLTASCCAWNGISQTVCRRRPLSAPEHEGFVVAL